MQLRPRAWREVGYKHGVFTEPACDLLESDFVSSWDFFSEGVNIYSLDVLGHQRLSSIRMFRAVSKAHKEKQHNGKADDKQNRVWAAR